MVTCAKDAVRCVKDAATCTKDAVMCAEDAAMCAEDAAMRSKDAARAMYLLERRGDMREELSYERPFTLGVKFLFVSGLLPLCFPSVSHLKRDV